MKVLHLIDALDYGGAETLLMTYVPLLHEYEHTVVTLQGPNLFEKKNYDYQELGLNLPKDIYKVIAVLRKIVFEREIDIVHSHSFWTNIVSRFLPSRKIKLFNHYHFADYDTMKHKTAVRAMILIDKILNKKKLTRLAVSEYSAKVLKYNFPKSKIEVIPNFINNTTYEPYKKRNRSEILQVVAIGNCNLEKNYDVVLHAFELLKDEPITIDIMGGGFRLEFYKEEAKRLGVENVRFLGSVPNAKEKLKSYDIFLSSSISETFGIAVLEGIAANMPLLLSDIPAYREIAPTSAVFFNPHNKNELVQKLKSYIANPYQTNYSDYETVLKKYSLNSFLSRLKILYNL